METLTGLLEAIKLGKHLILESASRQGDELFRPLVVLLNIESMLDTGRMLLEDEAGLQALHEINRGMDEIRAGISAIMQKIDKRDLEHFLQEQGEKIKSQFIK